MIARKTGEKQLNQIGLLRETSLHASLKEWFAGDDDHTEVEIDGFLVDLVRGDELIEIQTANFSALKSKIKNLLNNRKVRLVYPIAKERWIIRQDREGQAIKRRKSPKRGRIEDLFDPLVSIPGLVDHPRFIIEVLLIQDEIIWRDDGRGSWRRGGWSISDRRLIKVLESKALSWPKGYLELLPPDLNRSFTNRDLADALNMRIRLAQKMTYCMSRMRVLDLTGRRGRYHLYTVAEDVNDLRPGRIQ